jgi:hypothetical protein
MKISAWKGRWRGWLIALLILGVIGGVVWWRSPRSYRAVAAIPVSDDTFAPTRAGVLVKEGVGAKTAFVLRSWVDGSVVWRVVPPGNAGIQRGPRYPSDYVWSISPSGRYFTAMVRTGDGGGQRVMIWREGKLVGEPGGVHAGSEPRLKALDDGRVFFYATYSLQRLKSRYGSKHVPAVSSVAYILQDSRILARGKLPVRDAVTVAPDGSAVVARTSTGFTYATIVVKDGRITLTGQYTGKILVGKIFYTLADVTDLPIARKGRLLAWDGSVYGPKGLAIKGPGRGWKTSEPVSLSPGGQHYLFLQGMSAKSKPVELYEAAYCRVRVQSIVTRQKWEWTGHSRFMGGLVCDNGQSLLLSMVQYPPLIERLIARMPAVEKRLGEGTIILGIYDQRGHLRSVMKFMNADSLDVSAFGKRYQSRKLSPSPDGRALVYIGDEHGGARPRGERQKALLLYRY